MRRFVWLGDKERIVGLCQYGFGEVGYSPTENILKEIEEETGFKAKVERLLAVFDTNRFQLQSK